MINKKSIATAVAAGSLLLNAFATTAYAANSVTIAGNGADSNSTATVSLNKTNTVVQNNDANISNNVTSNSNTGGNVANNNTGGDVLIATGNSASRVDIRNQANANRAIVDNCNCTGGATDVAIVGNGADSDNTAIVAANNSNDLFQNNSAYLNNSVTTNGNSGDNVANNNTGSVFGGSDVTILTGNVTSDVAIRNAANQNLARIGGSGSANPLAHGTSALISGNGADSDNSIVLSNNRSNLVAQNNDAYFSNSVAQNLSSGDNYANNNTGADVTIDTGSVLARTLLDNRANFNVAQLDCGCATGGIEAKIAGNGFDSDSVLVASMNDTNSVFNDNNAGFWNGVYDGLNSGDNYANGNTGPALFDPVRVFTGNSGSETVVSNSANMNVYSSSVTLPGGLVLNLGWDWNGLWGM